MTEYHGVYHTPSFSIIDYRDALEFFSSLREAKRALKERYETAEAQPLPTTPVTVDDDGDAEVGDRTETYFPATREDTWIDLYLPGADYPTLRLELGPRGGVTVTSH